MRVSFLQFIFLIFLGFLFFADFSQLAKKVKQQIKVYKKKKFINVYILLFYKYSVCSLIGKT